eukprot:scaffold3337_cov204-Alexandrium_tamarense.AAC.30
MAKKSRGKSGKQQTLFQAVAAGTSSSRTSPRKPGSSHSKKSTRGNGGGGGERVWMYAAKEDELEENQDEYTPYLNQRVQRSVVRSLPGSYSYFSDGDGGRAAAAISAGTVVKRNGGSDSFVKVESMPPDDDAGMDADGKNGAEGVNESAAVLSSGEAATGEEVTASTTTTSGEYPVQEATAEAVKSKEVKTEGPGDAEIKEVDEVSVCEREKELWQ